MMATKAASSSSLPKFGAISKAYKFASTWEQSAPLTEQQQAAIVSLSHAVAERPFPANLVYAAIQQELLPMLAKMKLYLQNPSTRTILFKPIKTNIVEAHTQVESLLKAEYSSEEQADINMISIQDLQAQLDNFL